MFTLLAVGAVAFAYLVPIAVLIVALLLLVTFSYRQTIRAYPGGGGSYIVAHANLGPLLGLVAAAALLTDYVLTVAVSVSSGVFLASAFRSSTT
jgi:amino acid transporter